MTSRLLKTRGAHSCLWSLLLLNLGAFIFGVLRFLVFDNRTDVVLDAGITPHPSRAPALSWNNTVMRRKTYDRNPKNVSEFQIPNIVHYIWFNHESVPLQFHQMLSIFSAYKVLKPEVIYFHTDKEPMGDYWEQVKAIPALKINFREPPTTLYGETVKPPLFYTSHSNVDRVKVLMEYGGIYLDFDVFITRPFDDLRKHNCVIGMESKKKACGSVILCEKSAMFLKMWINSYLDDYRMEEWAYNTGQVPAKLARRFPHLVHVEHTKLNRPNFKELDRIWGPNKFDWWNNYAVHIWYRLWKTMSPYYQGIDPDPENIKYMNNSFGEMARTVYYGSPALFPEDNI